MSRNTRRTTATPEQVWACLADGWLYPGWVVGAARMREVDDAWPQVGAKIHHSVGSWPALINDHSEVLESVPEQRLRLRVRGWPAGEAHVGLELAAHGTGTKITMTEQVTAGPGRLIPRPVEAAMLFARNRETLRRLCLIAEGRRPGLSHGPAAHEVGS